MSLLDDLNAGINSIADSLFGRKGQGHPQGGQPSWQGGPQGWQGGQQPQPQNWGQPSPQGWQGQPGPQGWQGQPGPQGWQGQQPMQQGAPAGQGHMNFGLGALAGAALAGMAGKGMAGAAKGAVLAGAGYAAWQFFKKWSAGRQAQNAQNSQNAQNASAQGWQQPAPLPGPDPQAMLAVRAVVYATRADGTVDAEEQAHITATMQQFFPGQDTGQLVQALLLEPLDVRAVVAGVGSMEQAEDVYAMSCMATGIDHPAERAYMNDLAAALCIPPERRDAIERGAAETRARLSAQTQAPAATADPVADPVAAPATAPVADPAVAPVAAPAAAPVAAPEPVQAEASAPAESAQPAAPKQAPSGQTDGTGNGV